MAHAQQAFIAQPAGQCEIRFRFFTNGHDDKIRTSAHPIKTRTEMSRNPCGALILLTCCALAAPAQDASLLLSPTQGRPVFVKPGSALELVALVTDVDASLTPQVTLVSRSFPPHRHPLETPADASAKLLAGQMPEDVEDAFNEAGLSLFPNRGSDLNTDCTCPDWSNPCKHVAAVYYLLGEEFDRDPFLIFKLRGIEREELTSLLGSQLRSAPPTEQEEEPDLPQEPLPEDPEAFWGQTGGEYDLGEEVFIPAISAALPSRLGNFPFWQGQEGFLTTMEKIYRQASSTGLRVFLGEYVSGNNDD